MRRQIEDDNIVTLYGLEEGASSLKAAKAALKANERGLANLMITQAIERLQATLAAMNEGEES